MSYFKGSWKKPFEKYLTWKEAPFFKLDGTEVKCERMRKTEHMQYAVFESLKGRAVILPFKQYVETIFALSYPF